MLSRKYEELIELAEKSGNGQDPILKKKILDATLHENEKLIELLERNLIELAERAPNPFPKDYERDFGGNILVGESSWNNEVYVTLDDLAHTTIWGATRQGKSVLLGRLATEIMENTNATVLIFDPKRSQRSLVNTQDRLYSVKLNNFPFNPFSLFEANQKAWLQEFAGLFAQTGDLMTGSRSFILDTLKSLESLFKSKNSQPTIYDFLEEVKRQQGKSPVSSPTYRYAERVSNRTKALLYTFEDTFNYETGFPIRELLDPSTGLILEYDGIDPLYAKTVILLIIQSVFHYQMVKGNRGGEIDLVVMLDEAEEILGHGRTKTEGLGVEVVNKLYERSKELQIGLISAVHHSRINPVVRENARSRFCFNLSSSDDIKNVAKDFGLNEDQEKIIEDLEVGEAVAKVKGQREAPFKIKVNPVKLEDIPEKEIKARNKELWKKVKQFITPREEKKKEKSSQKKSTNKKTTKHEEIDKNSHVLLESIARFPYLSISKRKDKLGWSNSRLSKTRKKLRKSGYIRKKRLKKPEGGRGSTMTILEATDKAVDYLKEEGVETNYIGRGGAVHSYYMQWFLDNLKDKNVDVDAEVTLNNVSVDLFLVKKSGETQAIEIEVTSADNTLDKLESLLQKVDKLLIACSSKVLVNEFMDSLEEMDIEQDRVSVKKIQEIEF
mgnify:CR=1 FL=1